MLAHVGRGSAAWKVPVQFDELRKSFHVNLKTSNASEISYVSTSQKIIFVILISFYTKTTNLYSLHYIKYEHNVDPYVFSNFIGEQFVNIKEMVEPFGGWWIFGVSCHIKNKNLKTKITFSYSSECQIQSHIFTYLITRLLVHFQISYFLIKKIDKTNKMFG